MLDQYMIDKGFKLDPKRTRGHFIGGDLWVEAMRNQLRDWMRKKKKNSSDEDPPDTS